MTDFIELMKQGERKRLDMIIAANKSGDKDAYRRAVNSYVNSKGEIVAYEDLPKIEKKELTPVEKLQSQIDNLEDLIIRQENMNFLPSDFYQNKDRLYELKAELKKLLAN